MKRRWTEHLIVLCAYTLIALALSYPLALHFGDAIAGVQGDVWSYLWAMGWARVSVLDLGVNPFRDNFVFYPLGGATQLMWATALPSFLSIPLQLAVGLVPAFNLFYLSATVLTAYGTYLLAKYVLIRAGGGDLHSSISPSAFVAGAAFAFSALRAGYGLAFTNLYHTELVPFYILFLLKTRYERGWGNALLAGVILGLNVYIDFQIAAFLILFSALWYLGSLFSWAISRREASTSPLSLESFAPGTRDLNRGLTSTSMHLAIIAIVSLITAAPLIAVVAQDLTVEGSDYIRVYPLKYSAARAYDALSYVLPNARSTLYQFLPAPQVAGVNAAVNVDGESQLSPDRQSFLGLVALALAVLGALSRPRALAIWIATTLLFALLSFGPTLHLAGGDLGIPLPYAALHELPIVNDIRIPMRYGLMTFLGVAILGAAGVNRLSTRVHFAPLASILTLLILGEAAVLPFPTLPVTVPSVYNTIASQPGDFTVLEIPTFNWRAAAATEFFQVIHHKQILRAYTNRIAPDLADYFSLRQTPIIVRSLRVLEGAEEGPITADELSVDRDVAPAVIRFYSIRYAVMHREWLDSDTAAQIDQYLREVLGARIFSQEGSVTAYEFVTPTIGKSQTLAVESDRALMYLGRGWQTEPLAQVGGESGRFVTGVASEIYVETAGCDCPAAELKFRAYSENSQDVLQFEWNGRKSGVLALKQGWVDYAFPLPNGPLQSGLDSLRLLHPPPEENHIAFNRFEIH